MNDNYKHDETMRSDSITRRGFLARTSVAGISTASLTTVRANAEGRSDISCLSRVFAIVLMFWLVVLRAGAQPSSISPAGMPRIDTVDERFQSYNVEMIEVTGGRFWKPYSVQMIAHNTLAASDYALLDEKTFTPRPNYWAAVLWRRLMGRTVLSPGPERADDLYIYAHCMPNRPGGVTVLAINAGKTPQDLDIPVAGERYTLTAKELERTAAQLNGRELRAHDDGALPPLNGVPIRAGGMTLAPASITFVAFPKAGNRACQ